METGTSLVSPNVANCTPSQKPANLENMELGTKGETLGGAASDASSQGLLSPLSYLLGCKLHILTEIVFVFQAQLEGIIAPKK